MQELNETAHRILDVAEHYTQQHGFNAFSYKDIQNEVGVKTSSIHYYFPTKQDLATCMAHRYVERFRSFLITTAQKNNSGIKQLKLLSQAFLDTLNKDKFCMCGMLASDILALPENVNSTLREFFHLNEVWIANAISIGQEQGDIKHTINPKSAASYFLAALEGGMLISRTQKKPGYLKAVITEALTQLKI